ADRQGRRPGIYTVMGGPPNNWSKATVDNNLRPLTVRDPDVPVTDYSVGPFDKSSIMKYYYEEWMFVSGKSSPCYSVPGGNSELSAEDKKRIAAYYPFGGVAMTRQERKVSIDSVLTEIPQSSLLAKELQARKDQLQ